MGIASSCLDLLNDEMFLYIKEGGSSDSHQFKRTCVLDSLLAACHTTYIKYPNVKVLLNSDELFRKIMTLLSNKKYVEAKNLCVQELKHVKVDDTSKEMDFYGSVIEHFVLFNKLVCETPKDSRICKEILGYWKALGDPADPTLILQCSPTSKSQLRVEDEKKRIFALQFMLVGIDDHMTMCFQSTENKWHLYDNDINKHSFQSFNLESLKDNDICLAGYVNINQVQEYKHGIAESGEGTGAMPFYSGLAKEQKDPYKHFYPQQSVADVEMEDLCCTSSYSIAIPETGEGLGPNPFYQNGPDPIFSNLKQPVEDTEMPSCSSSDSD